MEFSNIAEKLTNLMESLIMYLPKMLLAIAILIIGFKVIKKVVFYIMQIVERSKLSAEIKPLLRSFLNIAFKVILIFSVMSILGIETSAFVASLAALSFAIGMAFQGALGHLASGLMIFLFRPYRTGHYIQVQDQEGYVQEIQLFNTVIKNLDNELILIPNGNIFGDVIVNSSVYENIRLSFSVHIPYGEEFKKVKNILENALDKTDLLLKTPKPFIGIKEFDTHTIILDIKVYSKIEDKEKAYFKATAAVKNALGINGIKMAYSEGIELGEIGA